MGVVLWASALLFASPSDSVVVFHELHYHPDEDGAGEWIELYNQYGVDIDLSGWELTDGVEYVFPDGTIIEGKSLLVIAANPSALEASHGLTNVLGPFAGNLDNAGERIVLENNSRRLMDSIDYNDRWPWPVAADGSGASLTKRLTHLPTGEAASWRSSLTIGGTPGAFEGFPDTNMLGFSEAGHDFIELANLNDDLLDLDGHVIASSSGEQYIFPAATIGAGSLHVVTFNQLGFQPATGDRLFLYSPVRRQVLDGIRVRETGLARLPGDIAGEFFRSDEATPGGANQLTFEEAIVINEIMYHPRPIFPNLGDSSGEIIFEGDALWRYYPTHGDPGDNWIQPDFDDSAWEQGAGAFGFGAGGIGETLRTELRTGSTRFYFRRQFDVSEDAARKRMQINLLADDGAAVYLNGEEIKRVRLPEGATQASEDVGDAVYESFVIEETTLNPGTNTIAVEVVQVSLFSNDVAFAMELLVVDNAVSDRFQKSDAEWIELYNRSDRPIDLGGWKLRGGVRFDFPEGASLEPDSYAVLCRNVSEFTQGHPDVNVLGEFNGRLADSSESLQLRDDRGNPADYVLYADGGRWDERADGHGPSLELRHPDADNAMPSAWRASDETARSEWQTYTYRATASTPVNGAPTLWQDFILGILDGAGECLLDDIRVIEDPDGAAIERLQNGSFDKGDAHWRLLGNHRHSMVEDDGTGNSVLRVVSKGATEYQGNQIETTLADRARIQADAVYEISYRARWISGASQLNTRLYFNRAAKTTVLAVPTNNGTPGRQNSQFFENTPPDFGRLTHAPVIPASGQDVTITVPVYDPDGIATAVVYSRVEGGDWNSAPMAIENGVLHGTLPSKEGVKPIQFYVEATDTLGMSSTVPALGADSFAFLRRPSLFGDTGGGGDVDDFRVLMFEADAEALHARGINTLSNERLGCTVIHDGVAYYDAGIRLKGSFVGRDADRVGFNIRFPSDQLFRGIHPKVSIDRSTHAVIGVDEVIIKHLATRAGGIPGMYDDIVHFFAPKKQHDGRALIRVAGFDDVYLDSQFESGGDGTMYEYEVYRWATTAVGGDPENNKNAGSLNSPNGFLNIAFRDFGNNKEDYRWHTLINTNRARDDYDSVIAFFKVFDLPAAQLEKTASAVMDVDSVLRTLAFQSLVGPGDAAYTGTNEHNFRLYAEPGGLVHYLPWDWDSAFQRPTSASLVGGGQLGKLVRIPSHLRRYHGHLLDIIERAIDETYLERWTDHYGALARQNFGGRRSYLNSRATFVRDRLPDPIPFEITTNDGEAFTTRESSIQLIGNGWIDVAEIRSATSGLLQVDWLDEERWRLTAPLNAGVNSLELNAYNHRGELVGSDNIAITNEGGLSAAAAGNLIISEIMYHPADGGVEYLELLNTSDAVLDLSGVRFGNGINFIFADDSTLAPAARLILTESAQLFAVLHGGERQVAGEFANETRLSNGGETLTLLDATGNVIESFAYNDGGNWPAGADGEGASLIRKDPVGDPGESANWRSSVDAPGMPSSEFGITTIERTPAGIEIRWFGRPGSYTIQYSQNLQTWMDVAVLEDALRFEDTESRRVSAPGGYYRLKLRLSP